MKTSLSVTELKNVFKEIQRQPERIFEMMRTEMTHGIGEYLTELMRAELSHFLGREPYERKEGETNHPNGSYERQFTMKRFGEVTVKVPRDREGELQSDVLPRSKRYEDELRKDVCLMYLTGVSTRTLSMISKQLLGRKISAEEVSRANQELIEAIERRRMRSLEGEKIKYLLVDRLIFAMRAGRSVETVPVLVAIGEREDGTRLVLGLQAGDKESAANWREFFKDLKSRGFRCEGVTLGVMDGLTGKEFKRRTNSMEIVAGENACYRLLAFISLKMEMHWKRNPIGKAAYHLPIFQKVPLAEFTQNA
jgi:putative transposase